ncbi:MAG: glycosyltransferase family 4 protein [Acidimicrobiales bacterium]
MTTPVDYSVRAESSRTLRAPTRLARRLTQVEADDQRNGVGPPKRICVVGSGWRFLSGISYYTCRMSNSLAETDYEVSAILMRRLLPRRLYPGKARVGSQLADLRYDDSVRVLDGVDYFWWPSLLRALRFLLRERPDVVVFEWWSATVLHTYLVLAAVARLLGARVVIEFHETLDSAEATMMFPRLYADIFIRPMLWIASGYAVHSGFDRDVISKRYPVGTKPVAVVPHGPYNHGVRASERRPRGPDDPVRLLFFGTIRPYKGLEHLIDAFDGLTDAEAERFSLTVAGETWEGWDIPTELIARARHRDRIVFVNRYVTDAEATTLFSEADVVVLPYLRSSASGPLHMAMSHGLSVIVTAVGGLTEAATLYQGTTFVPPGDTDSLREAIRQIDPSLGVHYPDPFSWAESAGRLASLFVSDSSQSAR